MSSHLNFRCWASEQMSASVVFFLQDLSPHSVKQVALTFLKFFRFEQQVQNTILFPVATTLLFFSLCSSAIKPDSLTRAPTNASSATLPIHSSIVSLPALQLECLSVSCERMESISRWWGHFVQDKKQPALWKLHENTLVNRGECDPEVHK